MLKTRRLCKEYIVKDKVVIALDDLSLDFPRKGMVFIVGKSGSGKSTFLHIIGGIDLPTSGKIEYGTLKNDNIIYSNSKIAQDMCSLVFQDHNLLNKFTVYDNLNMFSDKVSIKKVLEFCGLSNDMLSRKVNSLSGGERQRVAISRALLKSSSVILLDEPTGNLDDENTNNIMELLLNISKTKLVIMVSHDLRLAYKFADRIISFEHGKLMSDSINRSKDIIFQDFSFKQDSYELYFIIKSMKSGKCELISNKISKKIVSSNLELAREISDLQHLLEGETVKLRFIEKDPYLIYENEDYIQGNLDFNHKSVIRYIKNLFIENIFRISVSMLILILSISFLFVQLNISFVNEHQILNQIYDNPYDTKISLAIEECNVYLNECYVYENGANAIGEVKDDFSKEKTVLYIEGLAISSESNTTDVNINILESYNMTLVEYLQIDNLHELGKSEIIISDYIGYLLFNDISNDIIGKKIYSSDGSELTIVGVHNTNFIENDILRLSFHGDNIEKFQDDFKYLYNAVYVSKETFFLSFIGNEITLYASNFFKSDLPTKFYVNEQMTFGKLSDYNLEVTNSNGVFLSSDTIQIYNTEPDQNMIYYFKDIENSINRTSFENYVNMTVVFPNGIIIENEFDGSLSDVDVLISDSSFAILIQEYLFTDVTGVYINMNNVDVNFVDMIIERDYIITDRSGAVLYSATDILTGDLSIILNYVLVFLVSISCLVLYLNFDNILKKDRKNLGVLKSLGVSKRIMMSIFFIFNGILWLLSLLISALLGIFLMSKFNSIISGRDFLNFDGKLIPVTFSTFLIIGVFSFLVVIISIVFPLRKLSKLTAVEVIRSEK